MAMVLMNGEGCQYQGRLAFSWMELTELIRLIAKPLEQIRDLPVRKIFDEQ